MSTPASDVRRPRPASEIAASYADRAGRAIRRQPGWSAACGVLALWALIANFAGIGSSVTGRDEPFYAIAAWRYIHGMTGHPPAGTHTSFDNFEHAPFAKYLFGVAQLVAGHPSVVADRVVAALCTLGTAVLIGVWVGRLADRWAGLGAAALIAVLPMRAAGLPYRFGRYGYLDPVAEFFAVASVILAWHWFRRAGRAGWLFAAATGLAVGLATSAKENGFLGAVGPIVLGLVLAGIGRRDALTRLLQAGAAVAVSVVVFVVSYLRFDDPFGAIAYLLRIQRLHSDVGHPVSFAGRTTSHPPGWAFLWFAAHGMGAVVTVACLVCVLVALIVRRDALVWWCVAALAGPLVFHMGLARVILPYYWVMWMPAFLVLVALGAAELVRLPASGAFSRDTSSRIAIGGACIAVFAIASVTDTVHGVTRSDPATGASGYAKAVRSLGPMVYMRLDEAGGAVATDASGNGHDGTYLGHPRHTSTGLVAGAGRAVLLDGRSQSVAIAGGPWISPANYSGAVWFSTGAHSQYLASHDNYSGGKEWDLQMDAAGRLRFTTFSAFGSAQQIVSPGRYGDGKAHLAVFTRSGSAVRLYVDGRPVASGAFRLVDRNTSAVPIDLGRRGNGTGYFHGTLDEFAYFATTLSADDVTRLYAARR